MKNIFILLTTVLIIVVGMGLTGCGSNSDPIPESKLSEKSITAFSLDGVAGTINQTEKTIAIAVAFGKDVTAMVATFTTTGVNVKVGSINQVSGTTANDFTNQVTYKVTAADNTTQDYTVVVTVAASSSKSITSFSLNGVAGTIDEAGKTIAVTLPHGTPLTGMIATFTTTGSSVAVGSTLQISGSTPNNFTLPVTYTVTAANATTQDYTVAITVAASSAKAITAFSLNGSVGTINEKNKTILVTMPYGTYIMDLVATFTTTCASVKVGSTVQVSGVSAHNFTCPVTYTVIAADGSTQDYIVTVTVAGSSAKAITVFTFPNVSSVTTIDETAHTISVTVAGGTNVTALVASFITTGTSVKVGSTVQVSGMSAHDFASPVTYTVTAADGSSQDYIVTVTVAGPSVIAVTPADSVTNVAGNSTIVVTFSEVMNPATVTVQTDDGACSGSIRFSRDNFTSCAGGTISTSDNKSFTITPTVSLCECNAFKVMVTTAVKNTDGIAMSSQYEQPNGFNTQTLSTWTEYSGNPIFPGGTTSGTDRAYFPSILKVGYMYHLWYGDGSNTRHMTSAYMDFHDQTFPASIVTFTPAIAGAYHPHVYYKADGWGNVDASCSSSNFLMYTAPGSWASINVACSSDGDTWTNLGAITGINTCDANHYGAFYNFSILYESGTFKGYADNGHSYVQYHTSSDGKSWTCQAYDILASTSPQAWEASQNQTTPAILKSGSMYVLYYSSGITLENEAFGYATSSDGQSFTKYASNPIFSISDGIVWRDNRTYTPSFIQDTGTLYVVYYTGKETSTGKYSIGFAKKCGTPY